MIKPDLIACADLHLRTDTPRCRTDDFISAMWTKVAFLRGLSKEFPKATVVCAGDVFDSWHQGMDSPQLIADAIECLPPMIVVPGQHDLPQHSLANYSKSALRALECGRKDVDVLGTTTVCRIQFPTYTIYGAPFGQEPKAPTKLKTNKDILLWHKYVWSGQRPFPTADDKSKGHTILKRLNGYDLIITGDNHIPFHYCSDDGRMLINCGSMMRTTTIQKDYKPAVWLIQLEPLKVEKQYYPIEDGVVSTEHLDAVVKVEVLADFINEVGKSSLSPLDFVANVHQYAETNNLPQPTRDLLVSILDRARSIK